MVVGSPQVINRKCVRILDRADASPDGRYSASNLWDRAIDLGSGLRRHNRPADAPNMFVEQSGRTKDERIARLRRLKASSQRCRHSAVLPVDEPQQDRAAALDIAFVDPGTVAKARVVEHMGPV